MKKLKQLLRKIRFFIKYDIPQKKRQRVWNKELKARLRAKKIILDTDRKKKDLQYKEFTDRVKKAFMEGKDTIFMNLNISKKHCIKRLPWDSSMGRYYSTFRQEETEDGMGSYPYCSIQKRIKITITFKY